MVRALNALFAPLEAVLVCALAAVLGWIYHRVHLWLWDSLHIWFPILPGVLVGFAIGLAISFWGDPLGGLARRFGAPIAIVASAIAVFVRFHFDGLHAGPASGTEWARISHYLAQQGSRTMELAGTGADAKSRAGNHWLFRVLLAAEIASIFIASTWWSMGASVPLQPGAPANKHVVRKVVVICAVALTAGAAALFQQGCSGRLYSSYLASYDALSECVPPSAPPAKKR